MSAFNVQRCGCRRVRPDIEGCIANHPRFEVMVQDDGQWGVGARERAADMVNTKHVVLRNCYPAIIILTGVVYLIWRHPMCSSRVFRTLRTVC